MLRRLCIPLVTAALMLILLAPTVQAVNEKDFLGYWIGTDPLDGGDSRRGFTRNDDGTFSMIGRDSFLTLCDNTDRGVAFFSDGVADDEELDTGTFTITCFNNQNTVVLKAHYVLLDDNLLKETLHTQAGVLVTEILFHKVSIQ